MNTSNRFAIETMARQHQADIERKLHHSARFDLPEPMPTSRGVKVNFRGALIVTATAAVSLLLALGLSFAMVLALAVVP